MFSCISFNLNVKHIQENILSAQYSDHIIGSLLQIPLKCVHLGQWKQPQHLVILMSNHCQVGNAHPAVLTCLINSQNPLVKIKTNKNTALQSTRATRRRFEISSDIHMLWWIQKQTARLWHLSFRLRFHDLLLILRPERNITTWLNNMDLQCLEKCLWAELKANCRQSPGYCPVWDINTKPRQAPANTMHLEDVD